MIFSLGVHGEKIIKITVDGPIIDIRNVTISRRSTIDIMPKIALNSYDVVRLLLCGNEFVEEQFSYSWRSSGSYNKSSICFTELTGITEKNYLNHAGKPEVPERLADYFEFEETEDSSENEYDPYW